MTAAIVSTLGLLCDIVGVFLVAIEVVRVFRGPTTIDKGDTGAIGGSSLLVPNPDFEAHEKRKRRTMRLGLGFLVSGFVLQGIGIWIGVLNAS